MVSRNMTFISAMVGAAALLVTPAFAAKDGTSKCGDCHMDQRWAPSTFDHDKRTQFPLTGGHANVDCDKCHTLQREVQGKPVLFYRPTPKNCADCHGADSRPA